MADDLARERNKADEALSELMEIEEPDVETVQEIGILEGTIDIFSQIIQAIQQQASRQDFLKMVDLLLRMAVKGQRAVTGYDGQAEHWRGYATNIAWNPRAYAKIGFQSAEIDALLKLNRDYDLGLDRVLVEEASHYIY